MLKNFIAFAALLIVLCVAKAAETAPDPSADVPHLPPQHSTAFACDRGDKNLIVAVVASYSNGQVLRWDAWHMHGFTVAQLIAYHDSAPDSKIYLVKCEHLETT